MNKTTWNKLTDLKPELSKYISIYYVNEAKDKSSFPLAIDLAKEAYKMITDVDEDFYCYWRNEILNKINDNLNIVVSDEKKRAAISNQEFDDYVEDVISGARRNIKRYMNSGFYTVTSYINSREVKDKLLTYFPKPKTLNNIPQGLKMNAIYLSEIENKICWRIVIIKKISKKRNYYFRNFPAVKRSIFYDREEYSGESIETLISFLKTRQKFSNFFVFNLDDWSGQLIKEITNLGFEKNDHSFKNDSNQFDFFKNNNRVMNITLGENIVLVDMSLTSNSYLPNYYVETNSDFDRWIEANLKSFRKNFLNNGETGKDLKHPKVAEYTTPKYQSGIEGTMVDLFTKFSLGPTKKIKEFTSEMEMVWSGFATLKHCAEQFEIKTKCYSDEWSYVLEKIKDMQEKTISQLEIGDVYLLATGISFYRSGYFFMSEYPPRRYIKGVIASYGTDAEKLVAAEQEKIPDIKNFINRVLGMLEDYKNIVPYVHTKVQRILNKNLKIISGGEIDTKTLQIIRGDWDLIIDDILVDIKNTKDYSFTTDFWLQLLVYWLLDYKKYHLKKVGIWFSRFDKVVIFDLDNYLHNVLKYSYDDIDNFLLYFSYGRIYNPHDLKFSWDKI